MRAELVEDARELVRDVARAGDQDAPGYVGQVERLVGRDAVLVALAFGDGGVRADGDQDMRGGLLRAVGEADGVGPGDGRAQPRITQVPPTRYSSATATLAPCAAATRAARTPPEPAPMTKRS